MIRFPTLSRFRVIPNSITRNYREHNTDEIKTIETYNKYLSMLTNGFKYGNVLLYERINILLSVLKHYVCVAGKGLLNSIYKLYDPEQYLSLYTYNLTDSTYSIVTEMIQYILVTPDINKVIQEYTTSDISWSLKDILDFLKNPNNYRRVDTKKHLDSYKDLQYSINIKKEFMYITLKSDVCNLKIRICKKTFKTMEDVLDYQPLDILKISYGKKGLYICKHTRSDLETHTINLDVVKKTRKRYMNVFDLLQSLKVGVSSSTINISKYHDGNIFLNNISFRNVKCINRKRNIWSFHHSIHYTFMQTGIGLSIKRIYTPSLIEDTSEVIKNETIWVLADREENLPYTTIHTILKSNSSSVDMHWYKGAKIKYLIDTNQISPNTYNDLNHSIYLRRVYDIEIITPDIHANKIVIIHEGIIYPLVNNLKDEKLIYPHKRNLKPKALESLLQNSITGHVPNELEGQHTTYTLA